MDGCNLDTGHTLHPALRCAVYFWTCHTCRHWPRGPWRSFLGGEDRGGWEFVQMVVRWASWLVDYCLKIFFELVIGFGGIGIGFNLLVLWLLVFIICTTLLHSTLLHSTLLAILHLLLLYFTLLSVPCAFLYSLLFTFHLCFLFTLLLFFCHHCHLTSYTSLGLSSFCQVFVTYLHTL